MPNRFIMEGIFGRPNSATRYIVLFGFENYISIIAGVLLCYIVYQRYIHPLSRFPGPFFAGLTNFWRIYHLCAGKQHINDYNLHKKYGPVFRDGPNSLSFSDPRALETIYGHKTSLDKSDWYTIFLPDLSGRDLNAFTAMPAEQHRRLRKRAAGVYSAKGYEQTIDSNIVAWTQRIKDLKTVAFEDWSHYLTLDTMSEISYGEKLGFIEKGGDINGQRAALRTSFVYMNIMAFLPSITRILKSNWIEALQPYLDFSVITRESSRHEKPHSKKMDIAEFAMGVIKRQQLNGNTTEKPHITASLINLRNPDGSSLSDPEIFSESIVSVAAGSESAAYAIAITLYYILQNPAVYERLTTEVREASPNSNPETPVIKYTQTTELSYLNAVITEAMRLYPPFCGNFFRGVGVGGLEILPGIFVPSGTSVSVGAYISNRDKAIFGEDAEEFKPERWLPWGSERVNKMKKYHSTFGYGPRNCLGKSIALMEINKTIVEIFRRFEVALVHPEIPLKQKNFSQMIISDLHIRFSERNENLRVSEG